ncbi:hypothetical protein DAI22_09g134300 [Oryza sativa Japonica Group]|nr:hypothetical protein DAI22_09g134300 [Oryza sativa Japonica Group]
MVAAGVELEVDVVAWVGWPTLSPTGATIDDLRLSPSRPHRFPVAVAPKPHEPFPPSLRAAATPIRAITGSEKGDSCSRSRPRERARGRKVWEAAGSEGALSGAGQMKGPERSAATSSRGARTS